MDQGWPILDRVRASDTGDRRRVLRDGQYSVSAVRSRRPPTGSGHVGFACPEMISFRCTQARSSASLCNGTLSLCNKPIEIIAQPKLFYAVGRRFESYRARQTSLGPPGHWPVGAIHNFFSQNCPFSRRVTQVSGRSNIVMTEALRRAPVLPCRSLCPPASTAFAMRFARRLPGGRTFVALQHSGWLPRCAPDGREWQAGC